MTVATPNGASQTCIRRICQMASGTKNFCRSLFAVGLRQLVRDLKVFAEFVVAGRLADLRYSRAECVPIDVDCKRVEKQVPRQQPVKGQRGYLLEDMREGDLVFVRLRCAQEARECARGWLLVEYLHDADEARKILAPRRPESR